MSAFSWGLIIAGAFLLLYAIRVLLSNGEKEDKRRRQSLGCGFVLMTGLVWGLALTNLLGSLGSGLRLGFSLALLLPALAVLLGARRHGVIGPAIALILAVAIGATELPRLWRYVSPPEAESAVRQLESARSELQSRIGKTEAYVEQLAEENQELKRELNDIGHEDFDSLENDPDAYALLKELGQVNRLEQEARNKLESWRATVDRVERALRRLRRLSEAEQAMGKEFSQAEIQRVLDEVHRAPDVQPTRTVEEHVRREELRNLYKEEF